jgi:hypothetical protein
MLTALQLSLSSPMPIVAHLLERNALLAYTGLAHLALFFIALILSQLDAREVLGLNVWIKPMKFMLSIWIYTWTMAWLLEFLPKEKTSIISWTIGATMWIETILLVMQAARGVPSHFNVFTGAFNAAVFGVMGVAIFINTIAVGYATMLFFTEDVPLSESMIWAIRLGLILFIVAGVEGGFMARQLSHSVGVPDGGDGLPFLNWSVKGGDLRVAHFIGMHALQLLPLLALVVDKLSPNGKIYVISAAILYAAATLFVFAQALMRQPLISR